MLRVGNKLVCCISEKKKTLTGTIPILRYKKNKLSFKNDVESWKQTCMLYFRKEKNPYWYNSHSQIQEK